MREPRQVAVLGSCITRDNFNSRFNADYKRWFRVGPTTNQSSMIALMSPPVDEPWEPVREMKPYGLWNVHSDLSREIHGLLAQDQPDYLVLDFFGDIHFGVLETADGRYLTNNRWRLHKTDLYQRLKDDAGTRVLRWEDDEDGYFELWVDAMDRFAELVARECPATRVVVHCGFNAREVMEEGRQLPSVLGPRGKPARARARRANQFWKRINDHAATAYGWRHIDLREEWYVSFAEHPWGPFEVHYTMDYYHRFQAEMHRLTLRDELAGDLAARVDEVADASAARVREELAHWRRLGQQLDAQDDRPPAAPWRRLLGRPRRRVGSRPPLGTGEDHDLLATLGGELDTDAHERVAQLPSSADEHVAWIREVWERRLAVRGSAAQSG